MTVFAFAVPRRVLIPLLALLLPIPALATGDHLLLCEAALQDAEFIELMNPTSVAVDLSD